MVSDVSGRFPVTVGRFVVLIGICISLGVPLAAQVKATSSGVPRIMEPIDATNLATLRGNVHPLATSQYDQGEAPASTNTGRIQLLLRRSPAQKLALRQYLADLQNSHSPNYHKWLTPSQYGATYGIADSDLQAVEQWLQSYGFTIERVSSARNKIQFSGDFAKIESAFQTSIHQLSVNGKLHYANNTDPKIPAALFPVIAGVGPLNDFHPGSDAQFGARGHYNPSKHSIQSDLTLFTQTGIPYLYVDPADAAIIYDTPNAALNTAYTGTTYDGTGINIGVAGDSNITMQDVTNYRVAFLGETSTGANTPTVIVDGNDPLVNGDEAEALLDTEIAGGIAPKAKLYLYISADTNLESGLFDAITRAIDDNTVSILNISFGVCEAYLGTSGNQFVTELMSQAAAQGISVTVSTGDSGSAGCDSDQAQTAQNGLAVNGLASSVYNVAVGGTDFDDLLNNFTTYVQDSSGGEPYSGTAPYYATALSYIPERPWNDSTEINVNTASNVAFSNNGVTDIIAGAGGPSSCTTSTVSSSGVITCQSGYAKPAFQSALTPADGVRDLPDVSFLAGNGFYSAVWAVCADSVADGIPSPVFTDCQTDDGQFTSSTTFSGFGGTSAAAPTFAGILALVEQKAGSRLGQPNYVLYQLAQSKYSTVFHDVQEGDNSVVCTSGSPNCGGNGFLTGYDAVDGYDQASGLGSLDATQLLNNWNTVSLTSTTTSLTINGSTAPVNVVHGTSLTFNTGVSPAGATGVVGIVDTANEIVNGSQNDGQFAINLSGGTGSGTYNGLPGGSYTVYANYGGDTSDAASTSSGIPVNITPEASTTTLSVTAYAGDGSGTQITNLSDVPYGSYIDASALIYGQTESTNTQGVATGTVKYEDGGATLASLPVSTVNQAFYAAPGGAYPALSVGSHSLTAVYNGDASYNTSTSTATAVTVVKAVTSLSVAPASGSISSLASDQIALYLDVTSAGAAPTGTIVLAANGSTIATVNGLNGTYALVVIQGSALAGGVNTLTATYSGDNNYAGSSGTATVTVTEASFTLSNTGGVTVAAGATTGNTASVKVAPSNGFLGVVNLACSVTPPTGASNPATCSIPSTVNITGTGSVSTQLTATTIAATTAGAYTFTVTGSDANTGKLTASTSLTVTVTGTTAAAGFALSNSGAIAVNPGATSGNTAVVTVTPSNGFTGQVNLSCAVATSISNPVDTPTCNIPSSLTISGSAAATATLTVTTTAASVALRDKSVFGGIGIVAIAGLVFLVPVRRRRWTGLAILLALVSLTAIGCGGGSSHTTPPTQSSGTTAGAYQVTVTGVDQATGTITETTTVNVTVN
jgi:hypothetical protein